MADQGPPGQADASRLAGATGYVLAVDFGTSFTCGAVARGGVVSVVEVNGSRRVPSAVFWDEGSAGRPGRLLLGEDADNASEVAPWCFERALKRRLGDEFVKLGDQHVRVAEAVGLLMRQIADEAILLNGGERPRQVRLTHPAKWRARQLGRLRDAAAIAGFDDPVLIPEPVAAAIHFASSKLAVGEHVAVYDLGGGTFDTAVLKRTVDGFVVVGKPGGRDDLGGEDFDDRLYRFLGETKLDPEEWRALRAGSARAAGSAADTAARSWSRANRAFQRQVRRAKERLSTTLEQRVLVQAPVDRDLVVSVDELNELVRADLESTVAELRRTIEEAGLRTDQLAAIYLAGGSSRMPLVKQLIRDGLHVTPVYLDDPKSAIALGAARASVTSSEAPTKPEPRRSEPDPDTIPKATEATKPQPPTARVAPSITGRPRAGRTVSVSVEFSGTPPIAVRYQWQRAAVAADSYEDVPGAAGSTYRPTAQDVGRGLRVIVTGRNRAGETTATSPPTPAVTQRPRLVPPPGRRRIFAVGLVAAIGVALAIATSGGNPTPPYTVSTFTSDTHTSTTATTSSTTTTATNGADSLFGPRSSPANDGGCGNALASSATDNTVPEAGAHAVLDRYVNAVNASDRNTIKTVMWTDACFQLNAESPLMGDIRISEDSTTIPDKAFLDLVFDAPQFGSDTHGSYAVGHYRYVDSYSGTTDHGGDYTARFHSASVPTILVLHLIRR